MIKRPFNLSALMKLLLFSVFLSFFLFPSFSQTTDSLSEKTLVRFDRNHSTLGFVVPIVKGLSKVTGKFTDFKVDLVWEPENLNESSVYVEILVESIDTGIDGRNKHLKSADFFDVATWPAITFTSSSIVKDGDKYLVTGAFFMHGIQNEITIPLTTKSFASEEGNSWTAFHVNYVIDRTDYGMMWKNSKFSFFVGDEIETDIVLLTR